MADYADATTVKTILAITGSGSDARLAALNASWSRWLEQRAGLPAGAAFGTAASSVARTFYAAGDDTILLVPAARTVTAVTVDGTALAPADYRLVYARGPFWGGLYLVDPLAGWSAVVNRAEPSRAGWVGTVVVTGTWADQGQSPIDPLVTEAANALVSEALRLDSTGIGAVSGPEGLTFKTGDPRKHPAVLAFLERYAP